MGSRGVLLIERIRRWLSDHPRLTLAGYWAALIVVTHWPRLDVTAGHNDLFGGIVQVDKLIHAAAFGLLAWLLIRAELAGRDARRAANVAAALAVGLAYVLLDEFTQRWFQRQLSWGDVVGGAVGVASAAVLALSPRRVKVNGPRTWRTVLARVLWIATAPTLAFLAAAPTADRVIGPLIRYITEPQRGMDKQLHFWLSLGLTWLLAAGAPAGRSRPRLGAALTILVMAASAPVIELVQRETGRGFEVADVLAHQAGVLAALIGWAATLIAWGWLRPAETASAGAESTATPAEAGHARRGFVGHAVLVSALTFLSRITGLVRDAALAAVFGLGPVADAFSIGFLVPNLFRRLFGEGALSAAFIPHYTDLLKNDRDAARSFATLCLTLLTVLLCGLTVVGEAALWLALRHEGWSDATRLALELTMVMLPYMPLICLVALIGGVLQVHERFGPPATAPVVLNLVMIAATLWAAWGGTETAGNGSASVARVVAGGVVLAGVVQLIWQAVELLRVGPLRFRFGGAGVREAFRGTMTMLLPMLVGLAVFQINAFMDSGIAFALSAKPDGPAGFTLFGRAVAFPMDAGAVAALQWAQRLYQFPLGVFGIAIATAIFPALASAAATRHAAEPQASHGDEFGRILRQGLRLTVFIGLPASVGIIVLRLPLARVVYERGAFTFEDAQRVATILAGYSASIWAYSMTHVLTRGFYALKDSTTPLRVSLVMVGFNLVLNVVLIWPLGAAGLAWSTAISAVGQVALLLLAIRRRVPRPIDGYVLSGWARTAGLSVLMGAVLWPLLWLYDPHALGPFEQALLLGGLVLLGAAIFFAGAWFTGAEELSWLRRRGRGRGIPYD